MVGGISASYHNLSKIGVIKGETENSPDDFHGIFLINLNSVDKGWLDEQQHSVDKGWLY